MLLPHSAHARSATRRDKQNFNTNSVHFVPRTRAIAFDLAARYLASFPSRIPRVWPHHTLSQYRTIRYLSTKDRIARTCTMECAIVSKNKARDQRHKDALLV
eukprot:1965635-Rhodomonas_salina.1